MTFYVLLNIKSIYKASSCSAEILYLSKMCVVMFRNVGAACIIILHYIFYSSGWLSSGLSWLVVLHDDVMSLLSGSHSSITLLFLSRWFSCCLSWELKVQRRTARRVSAGSRGRAESSAGSQDEQGARVKGRRLRSTSSREPRPPAENREDQPSSHTEPL